MRARLTYQDYDGKTVTVELSADAPVTIGRSRDNNVVLRDEHASRMHCRVHFDRGQWWIRDFGLNGSKINGVRIDQESQLRHGDEVRVGDTRMRFTELDPAATGPTTKRISIPSPADPPPSTRLQHDDLTVLCNFMAAAVRETDSQGLLRKALDVVLHQTSAYLVGFLSDDLNEPVTKMVAPETARVDPQLSRSLIKRVHRDGRAVWLCTDMADTRTPDSPTPCSDALCLPVRSAVGRSLGTLHVYRTNTYFAERDLRFCEALVIYLANALHMMRNQKALQAENLRLRRRSPAAEDLVGDSDTLRELRSAISRVAHSPAPVLILGEGGAGKELAAVSLHNQSDRAGGPLVSVNCHAIAPSLFEAELFGYRKGAFSGADADHDGFLAQADDGSLFIDEIADLTPDAQARLVRVLEGRGFKQVGGTQELQANVRILAATAHDLAAEVKAGRFREDLYKRLKVITLEVPALREHAEDVPILVQYFLDKIGGDHSRQYRLTDAALDRLRSYRWPGNVRQLRAVLENAAALATGELLDVSDFRLEVQPGEDSDLPLDLEKLEAWAVREAMKRAGDNKSRAAQLLGIGRDALYAKIDKYGVE
ncbi:MAG: sigma 54-interacting transcriptional regulator [Gemmataceae bacterium]|nr:sigma 54-interacting transcriptional regulator [Gemmataceae bacterium]